MEKERDIDQSTVDTSVLISFEEQATFSDEEIRSTIDKNIDILIKNGSEHISEDVFIHERPEAFYEIVSLGRAALPYLNEIKDHDMESSNDRWFVAVMAAFAIAPNDQDKTFSSPDGKYILRAFDENTNTPAELTDYSLIVISDAETGKVLYEGKKMYRNIDVTWDAQRGYAVISHGICGYSRDVDIIDIQGSVPLELPEERDIRALAAAETGRRTSMIISDTLSSSPAFRKIRRNSDSRSRTRFFTTGYRGNIRSILKRM